MQINSTSHCKQTRVAVNVGDSFQEFFERVLEETKHIHVIRERYMNDILINYIGCAFIGII